MPLRTLSLLVACTIAVSFGCGSSTSAPAGGGSVSAAPDSPRLTANNLAFDRAELHVPAGRPFALVFDNQEALPHNMSIRNASAALFTGEVFTGPGQRVYSIPALAAGSYTFQCDVHPQMTGTLTAG
jgi:plastocyanin